MKKLEKNGKIAVVYSPGFGAGWYTWNQEHPEIIFDPTIVEYVLDREFDKLRVYMELKYPDMYIGGIDDLTVDWIEKGTAFQIREYDGNESIELKDNENWLTA